MGGKASTPEAPDYASLAEQTSKSDRETLEQQTWANRPDQWTPFGSTSWENIPEWDPSTGQYLNKWTQNTILNPESQRALDAQLEQGYRKSELGTSMLGRMENEYGQEMDWGSLTDRQQAANPYEFSKEALQRNVDLSGLNSLSSADETRRRAEEAIYNKGASRLDTRTGQDREAKEVALLNQGLHPGDEAYDRAMRTFEEGTTDAYGQLQMDSVIGGGQEGQRDYGMDLSTRQQYGDELFKQGGFYNDAAQGAFGQDQSIGQQGFNQEMQQAGFTNDVRTAELAEQMQKRGFTLNEINAIMSGEQVGMPSMPGFSQAGKAQATNYSQAGRDQFSADKDIASLEQAQQQMMIDGVTGVAGAMPSDRRLKREIEKVATHPSGLSIYSFRYVWDASRRCIGFMADEVIKLFPEAVIRQPDGYDWVDYGAIK